MRTPMMALGVVALASSVLAGQITIRPGSYEYTVEMKLGAAGQAGKAVLDAADFQKNTRRDCITASEASGDVAQMFAREMGLDGACKMSNVKTAGNSLTFTTTCVEDGLRMTMNTEMSFNGDSFGGITTARDQGGNVTTIKLSARRVGDCK